MIQVFSSPDLSDAYAVKDLLEEHGIAAHVFNENVSRMPGAFFRATPDVWPSVHIADDNRLREAKVLIQTFEKNQQAEAGSSAKRPSWKCPKCKEENDASFEVCWKCGKER
jgi:hypothetical protein